MIVLDEINQMFWESTSISFLFVLKIYSVCLFVCMCVCVCLSELTYTGVCPALWGPKVSDTQELEL